MVCLLDCVHKKYFIFCSLDGLWEYISRISRPFVVRNMRLGANRVEFDQKVGNENQKYERIDLIENLGIVTNRMALIFWPLILNSESGNLFIFLVSRLQIHNKAAKMSIPTYSVRSFFLISNFPYKHFQLRPQLRSIWKFWPFILAPNRIFWVANGYGIRISGYLYTLVRPQSRDHTSSYTLAQTCRCCCTLVARCETMRMIENFTHCMQLYTRVHRSDCLERNLHFSANRLRNYQDSSAPIWIRFIFSNAILTSYFMNPWKMMRIRLFFGILLFVDELVFRRHYPTDIYSCAEIMMTPIYDLLQCTVPDPRLLFIDMLVIIINFKWFNAPFIGVKRIIRNGICEFWKRPRQK